jgi:hypothetical protein
MRKSQLFFVIGGARPDVPALTSGNRSWGGISAAVGAGAPPAPPASHRLASNFGRLPAVQAASTELSRGSWPKTYRHSAFCYPNRCEVVHRPHDARKLVERPRIAGLRRNDEARLVRGAALPMKVVALARHRGKGYHPLLRSSALPA